MGQAFELAQSQREISASGERSAGLAPDDESSLGAGAGEPAAWLFLVSPLSGEALPLTPAEASPAPPAAVDLAAAERWVRRLAWGSDGRRGTARLEIGAGTLEGAELVITTEAGHVSVDLRLPEEADAALSERLRSRLEALGYAASITRG